MTRMVKMPLEVASELPPAEVAEMHVAAEAEANAAGEAARAAYHRRRAAHWREQAARETRLRHATPRAVRWEGETVRRAKTRVHHLRSYGEHAMIHFATTGRWIWGGGTVVTSLTAQLGAAAEWCAGAARSVEPARHAIEWWYADRAEQFRGKSSSGEVFRLGRDRTHVYLQLTGFPVGRIGEVAGIFEWARGRWER